MSAGAMTDAECVAIAKRAAAALAEVGYGHQSAGTRRLPGGKVVPNLSHVVMPPIEIRWKAWFVAGAAELPCLACYRWTRPGDVGHAKRSSLCTERGLGSRDCGSDRDGWAS